MAVFLLLGVIIPSMEKLVRDALELFHVHLTGRHVMSLITYEKELMEWNQKFNLWQAYGQV